MGLFDKLAGNSGKDAKAPAPARARTPMIAGNWKMNCSLVEAVNLSQAISYKFYHPYDKVEIVLCPAFPHLRSVWNVLVFDKSEIKLGAQDCHWEDKGAYTGCVSVEMVRDVGCDYCIIGHSERRGYFGETDADVNRKAKALIAKGVYPIMCCGESLECRDAGDTLAFVTSQVRAGLEGIEPADVAKSVIAYEPIWAIGTGRTATPEQAQEVCAAIRATVAELFGQEAAEKVRILYGGSMKPENAVLFLPMEDIDGGLIGGAALDADSFGELVKAAE